MLSRLVLAFLILLAAYAVLQRISRRAASTTQSSPNKITHAEPMVKCCHCGVYVPQGEAVFHEKRAFCSPEHRVDYLHQWNDTTKT